MPFASPRFCLCCRSLRLAYLARARSACGRVIGCLRTPVVEAVRLNPPESHSAGTRLDLHASVAAWLKCNMHRCTSMLAGQLRSPAISPPFLPAAMPPSASHQHSYLYCTPSLTPSCTGTWTTFRHSATGPATTKTGRPLLFVTALMYNNLIMSIASPAPLRSFRVGSGASDPDRSDMYDFDNTYVMEHPDGSRSAEVRKLTIEDGTHTDGNRSAEVSVSHSLRGLVHGSRSAELHTIHALIFAMSISIVCIIGSMMPQGQGGLNAGSGSGSRDFNYRIPPAWSPENDTSYTFRAYMTDMSLWIMLTDLQPYQQAAAIVMKLGGTARELARMITPAELMHGGVRNGVALDPVTYLLGALQERFAALDEESRLASMTEMLAFSRRPGETINALLARYEIVRQRAATEGQFVMSIEGCALQILRACNVHPNQLMTLLQPFGGRMPNSDADFIAMCTTLRRWGHIAEGTHGNIATVLSGPFRQARQNAYFGDEAETQPEAVLPNAGDSASAYWNGGQQQTPLSMDPSQPLADWAAGGSRSAEPGYPVVPTTSAYPSMEFGEDTDTDTDTSSDSGNEDLPTPGVSSMSQADAAAHTYLEYRRAKTVSYTHLPLPTKRIV